MKKRDIYLKREPKWGYGLELQVLLCLELHGPEKTMRLCLALWGGELQRTQQIILTYTYALNQKRHAMLKCECTTCALTSKTMLSPLYFSFWALICRRLSRWTISLCSGWTFALSMVFSINRTKLRVNQFVSVNIESDGTVQLVSCNWVTVPDTIGSHDLLQCNVAESLIRL